jgi:two-component response regulator (ARR-B family)
MLQANIAIPFDANSFFEEIANGDMPASSGHLPLQHAELANQPLVHIQPSSAGQFNQVTPSSHLPLHSSELVNQPLIQIQTSSVDLSNYQVDKESHQFSELYNPINSSRVSVPTRFPDIGHSAGMPISSSHGNHVRINQLSRSVASFGYVPTFGSQHQNQMSGLLGRTTPTLGFSEQAAHSTLEAL